MQAYAKGAEEAGAPHSVCIHHRPFWVGRIASVVGSLTRVSRESFFLLTLLSYSQRSKRSLLTLVS